MTFSDLGLPSAFDAALAKQDIITPMPIQVESIPVQLSGKDIYISSETGTGKTLAYLLPVLHRIDPGQKTVQAIVIAPTHELAMQIGEEARRLAMDINSNIGVALLVGAGAIKRQQEKLKQKPQLVIGSPGRILDLIKLKKLKVHTVKTVVTDEVDKLLFGDALDTTRQVIQAPLHDRQLVYVSATVRRESFDEASALSPGLILINQRTDQVNSDIEHMCFESSELKKPELLRKLLHAFQPERAMVFVHRNTNAEQIAKLLSERKIPVGVIHGACDKIARKQALDAFRRGDVVVLICSDVAARGMDIKGVTHIFNLDIPTQSEDYLHRAGRTGRAGAKGYCISLMTHQELRLAQRYRERLDIHIIQAVVTHGEIHAAPPTSPDRAR